MGKPRQVQGVWYSKNSLKTLHYDWSQCYQPVVIQAAGGHLVTGRMVVVLKDLGENSRQFAGPCSMSPPRDVLCSCCLTGMKG